MKKTMIWTIAGAALFIVASVGTFFALLALPVPSPLSPRPNEGPVAIENVALVDLEAGVVRAGQTIIVDEGRIRTVGLHGSVVVPANGTRIDGTDQFLIPGLWDMHAHHGTELSPLLSMPLFISNGVTGIRDMGGHATQENKDDWNARIRKGELLGPRVLAQASWNLFRLESTNEARELAAELEPGQGFIKVFNPPLPEPYFTFLEEAQKKGVQVLGHRPRAVSAIDAARAGHLSFEHARLFLFESFPGAPELRENYRARYAGEVPSIGRLDNTDNMRAMLDEHDPRMFDELVAAMVDYGTWFCPTHVTRRMDAFADDDSYRNDPRLKYIQTFKRLAWNRDADRMVNRDPSPRGRKTYMEFYEKGLELTGKAHRAGVKVLAGSDANDSYSFPGFSLHDELVELVKAGLTPAEALQTATMNPAEYMGLSDVYGTIAEGKVADMVLLDANPLVDIENTKTIRSVIYDGNVYTREDLDQALDFVEKNASSLRLVTQIVWANGL